METVNGALSAHRATASRTSNGCTRNAHDASLQQASTGLVQQLRSRRSEIVKAILAHLYAASDPANGHDADYRVGLRVAAAAAVDHILIGADLSDEWSGTIPSEVVAQTHRAARNGVDLDTVLLTCAAGHRVLSGFVIADAHGLPTKALGQVLDIQSLLIERLMATISIEHNRELARMRRSPDRRHAELVRELLVGEQSDTDKLDYDLHGWHIGIIATGVRAKQALRTIAASVDRHLLAVSHGKRSVWAWLGGKSRLTVSELEQLMPAENGTRPSLAIGEPGSGVEGWRLTHQQAQAARLVALHRGGREAVTRTRYAENMLLAAALRNETLAQSLRQTFLSPLAGQDDGGAASIQTLREYLSFGCNASATGSALGVNRHTIETRVAAAQKQIGRDLDSCLVELEVALRLHELDSADRHAPPSI